MELFTEYRLRFTLLFGLFALFGFYLTEAEDDKMTTKLSETFVWNNYKHVLTVKYLVVNII